MRSSGNDSLKDMKVAGRSHNSRAFRILSWPRKGEFDLLSCQARVFTKKTTCCHRGLVVSDQFVCMPMMQTTRNHSLCPAARVTKKYVLFDAPRMYFHVLSKHIGQDIKLRSQTLETNSGDRSVQSSKRSVVKLVWNFVLMWLIE
jgi:hypothetical protein